MKILNFIKTLAVIVAIGIFLIQMEISLEKFLRPPIVQQVSTVKFDEIRKPLIYVCQDGQFNYSTARSNGYRSLTQFLMGMIQNQDNLGWNGKYENKTFEELKEEIYEYDYTSLVAQTGKSVNEKADAESEVIFIVPFGICTKLKQTNFTTLVKSTERNSLYLVDPAYLNRLKILGNHNVKLGFGSMGNGLFEASSYEIELALHNSKLKDGDTCLDFENNGKTFGQCVENSIMEKMLKWFGCSLPWYTQVSNPSCEGVANLQMTSAAQTELRNFIIGWETESIAHCKKPCLTMSFELNEIGRIYHNVDDGYVHFSIKKEVNMITDVYGYDLLSFIVDLGSALGLWLGLSALGIVNTLIHFVVTYKSKCLHKFLRK